MHVPSPPEKYMVSDLRNAITSLNNPQQPQAPSFLWTRGLLRSPLEAPESAQLLPQYPGCRMTILQLRLVIEI